MQDKIYWGSYTTNELTDFIKEDPVVLLPVGAYEQHGPHLPLDTDTHIASELTQAAVAKATVPCALLPPVWLGISEHHMDFSGTLTLRHSTMVAYVYDILRSLVRHGLKKFLLVNTHGGNMAVLRTAIDQVGADLGVEPVLVTYWHLVRDVVDRLRQSESGGISHGCELETSLKMFLKADDVRKDRLRANIIPSNDFWGVDMFAPNRITIYKPYKKLSEQGHVGDPTKATKEFGKAVFNAVVDEMIKLIRLLHEGEL
mgnify:CR=1 FL=1